MWAIFQPDLKKKVIETGVLHRMGQVRYYLFLLFLYHCVNAEPEVLFNPYDGSTGGVYGAYSQTTARKKIDLAGVWQYSLGSEEKWQDVSVPSSIDYVGESTFRRKFTIDSITLSASSIKLVAYGINNECEVLINDIYVGKHTGGFSVFEIPIPDGILHSDSANEIQIKINNKLKYKETIPPRTQIWGWKNYHGIVRDIFFLVCPKIQLDDISIRTRLSLQMQQGEAVIKGNICHPLRSADLNENPNLYNIAIEIVDGNNGAIVASSLSTPFKINQNAAEPFSLSAVLNAPKYWSPENPALYKIIVTLYQTSGKQRILVDQYIRNVGFVSVVSKGGKLEVNGTQTLLKGIVWHEDGSEFGASLSYEQMEKDIAMIKSLGANAIRCAFHPPHPYIIDLCNRYGLFVLVELPVWGATGEELAQKSFQTQAESMAYEMIRYAGTASSVLAWGIGTCFDSADPEARDYVQSMVQYIHTLDDRPVYYGTACIKNDLCARDAPCVGLFPLTGDSKEFRQAIDVWRRSHPNEMCFVLGYGKEVLHDNRNGYSDPFSQQAQARFFIQHYTAIKEASIAGGFIDAFADWRGDRPILTVPIEQPTLYPRGLVNSQRQKRIAFDVVRALYSNDKINPIPIGKYKSTLPVVHLGIGFFLVALGGYLLTYNRRFGESFRRAFFRSYNFFEDVKENRAASSLHTIITLLFLALVLALLTSGILYYYRTNVLFDCFLTALFPMSGVKEIIIFAAWHPLSGILILAGGNLIFLLVSLVLAKIITAILGKRFFWKRTIMVVTWGSAPILLLLPIAMVIFKMLNEAVYAIPAFVCIGVIILWSLLRILSGIAITYETKRATVFFCGILIACVLIGGIYVYYDQTMGFGAFTVYLYHLVQSV